MPKIDNRDRYPQELLMKCFDKNSRESTIINSLLTMNNQQSTTPVISIRNLDHYFGQGDLRKQVLFDINLKLYSGEIVILTGPSGSGKTTLLTLMGGLRSAQSGSLQILGQEILGASKQ
jgi:putative ABC transport system ATP-binding protein